ncbi:flagellar export chaperone FlgN [Bacillus tianshenii]|nr:flagellar export chaperone FlgN [Bacillus tianshenii]
MSAERLTKALETLVGLHEQLNKIAVQKREFVKNNELENLQELLKVEGKFIQAVRQIDRARDEAVNEIIQDSTVDKTFSNCLNFVTQEERAQLQSLQQALLNELQQLQQQNQLNQELLQQSLHFVNFSIEMMLPEPEEYNYERSEKPGQFSMEGRSIFDSKA